MDDDGEFPASHPSPDTVEPVDDGNDEQDAGSPRSASPEPANGRLITLALPIQTRRSTPPSSVTAAAVVGGGGGGGREDCWTEEATAVLIEAWGERYAEQSRGILKQKQWEEVAEIVSARAGAGAGKPARTDVQCKNRIDTVKRKYKGEKAKIAAGAGPSNWIFFDRLERLLGIGNPNSIASAAKISHAAASKNPAASSISQQSHAFLRRNNGRTKRPVSLTVDSDPDSDGLSPESSDSLPPRTNLYQRSSQRQKTEFNSPPLLPPKFTGAAAMRGQRRVSEWSNSVRELTRVIAVFSEAYEQAESEKLQQMVEMEKQRMKFAKELELQRMKFLMKTQLQLSKLGRRLGAGGSGGGGGESNHRQGRHVNDGNNVNNNSGCSN